MGDQPLAMPLPIHRTTQKQNKRIHTSMSLVEIEPAIPVFELVKTVHVLDSAATVMSRWTSTEPDVVTTKEIVFFMVIF
jgi:hypothetical protein